MTAISDFTRVCKACKLELPLNGNCFSISSTSSGGFYITCKKCTQARRKLAMKDSVSPPALELTADLLRSQYLYCAATGLFTRKTTHNIFKVGSVAGSVNSVGYVMLVLGRKKYAAHRLVFLYVHGVMPAEQVDHINGIKNDNRLVNLRCVSPSVNNQNRIVVRSDNSSGAMGVSRCSGGEKWRARIMLHGKETSLGRFDTKAEASMAYLKAKRKMHEGCTI